MRIENSFIPVEGVGETTERRIWREGVTTWESFDPAVDVAGVGSTTADRIESFIAEALTHLDDGDSAYFDRTFPSGERWRLYENFREETCFFDIETTGLDEHRDRVTTVSFHRDGETTTLVAGEDLTAERLREQFADASLLATFNGARFDVPFLETAFDIEIDTPHLDPCTPASGSDSLRGLKPIEKEIGIERDRPDLSGRTPSGSGASTNAATTTRSIPWSRTTARTRRTSGPSQTPSPRRSTRTCSSAKLLSGSLGRHPLINIRL